MDTPLFQALFVRRMPRNFLNSLGNPFVRNALDKLKIFFFISKLDRVLGRHYIPLRKGDFFIQISTFDHVR
jgi:hypothetical protein